MSAACEIAPNFWLGPTPDANVLLRESQAAGDTGDELTLQYDMLIEATDTSHIPDRNSFSVLEDLMTSGRVSKTSVPQLEFPGSGSIMPPTWSQTEVDGLMHTCAWIYKQANGQQPQSELGEEAARTRQDSKVESTTPAKDGDGDSIMLSENDLVPTDTERPNTAVSTPRRILLHCGDGYTETTLLAVAYYMYANCVPLHEAYIQLHITHKRNFFAYPSDIALLTTIQPRILQSSPANKSQSFAELNPPAPNWMSKVDGSLPSRITDYMYLGNLAHANNPGLLNVLGIGQVLSIGEPLKWSNDERKIFSGIAENSNVDDRLMFVDKVQDNGVDPLTEEFPRCLQFIGESDCCSLASDISNTELTQLARQKTVAKTAWPLSSTAVSASRGRLRCASPR